MDPHALAPLLAPQAIVVFAGPPDAPDARDARDAADAADAADARGGQTAPGRAVHAALRAQRYAGTLRFLDIHATGSFAELAQVRADLAVIALPESEVAAALDAAVRLRCRAAPCGRRQAARACCCSGPTAWASRFPAWA
jgi:acetyltransferase